MYKLFSLLSILAIANVASARLTPAELITARKAAIHQQLAAARQQPDAATAAKGAAIKYRLIATSGYDSGTPSDSSRFFYTGLRGSQPIILSGYINSSVYNNVGQDGLGTIMSDSSLNYDLSGGSPHIVERIINTYNTAGKTTSVLDHVYSFPQYSRTDYTYNTAGFVSRQRDFDTLLPGNPTLQPSQDYYSFYDAQNHVVKDSVYDLRGNAPLYRENYTYDAGGNLTSLQLSTYNNGQWELAATFSLTYYTGTTQQKRVAVMGYNSNVLTFADIDSFGYSGTNALPTFELYKYLDFNTNTYVNSTRTFSYLKASGDNYDSVKQFMWDASSNAFLPDILQRGYYNAQGVLSYVKTYSASGTTFNTTEDSRYNFYYQSYNDPTAVPHTTVAGKNIMAYPNPVASTLFFDNTTGYISLAILDAQGRLVQSGGLSTAGADVSQLPAGWYSAILTNATGTGSATVRFIKK